MHRIFGPYRDFWERYADGRGKTSRRDFWLAIWMNVIIYLLIIGYIFAYKGKYGAVFGIFALAVYTFLIIIPFVAIQVRRYRDVGLSGWWLLLTLLLPIVLKFIQLRFIPRLTLLSITAAILGLIDLVILVLPKKFVQH